MAPNRRSVEITATHSICKAKVHGTLEDFDGYGFILGMRHGMRQKKKKL